jgi:saccharopine dehydrogenase-like NADP-dependent oxidoreductase
MHHVQETPRHRVVSVAGNEPPRRTVSFPFHPNPILSLNLPHRARAAGVLLLNEIGLDPGIDHCSALSLIKKIRSENKDIVSFTSFCGGLPAPDVPFGPLRYKFSWSPRAVLDAASNAARFRLSKQVTVVFFLRVCSGG